MIEVGIVEAKAHFSELIMKSTYNQERYIITKRNKPVAAIISIEDLTNLEQYKEKTGLAAIAGKWEDFDEVEHSLNNLSQLRASGGSGRNVSF